MGDGIALFIVGCFVSFMLGMGLAVGVQNWSDKHACVSYCDGTDSGYESRTVTRGCQCSKGEL